VNSSPLTTSNFLVADIALVGGRGGDGRNRRRRRQYLEVLQFTDSRLAAIESLSFLAGNGGNGTTAKGVLAEISARSTSPLAASGLSGFSISAIRSRSSSFPDCPIFRSTLLDISAVKAA
jgi:hypothetical protein